jgi:hypothetical protein
MKKILISLISLLLVTMMSCLSIGEKVLIDSYNDIIIYKTDKIIIQDFFYENSMDLYIWQALLWEKISEQDIYVTCYIKCPPADKKIILETKTIRLEATITFNKETNEVILISPKWVITDKDKKPIDIIDLSSDFKNNNTNLKREISPGGTI